MSTSAGPRRSAERLNLRSRPGALPDGVKSPLASLRRIRVPERVVERVSPSRRGGWEDAIRSPRRGQCARDPLADTSRRASPSWMRQKPLRSSTEREQRRRPSRRTRRPPRARASPGAPAWPVHEARLAHARLPDDAAIDRAPARERRRPPQELELGGAADEARRPPARPAPSSSRQEAAQHLARRQPLELEPARQERGHASVTTIAPGASTPTSVSSDRPRGRLPSISMHRGFLVARPTR